MRLAIVGSRSITDHEAVERTIRHNPFVPESSPARWSESYDFSLISGGANGVDTSAETIAAEYGIDIEVIEPDYSDWSGNEHPAKRRNTKIVEAADAVLAIWDGHSNGTRDTIDKALDRGVPIYVEVIE